MATDPDPDPDPVPCTVVMTVASAEDWLLSGTRVFISTSMELERMIPDGLMTSLASDARLSDGSEKDFVDMDDSVLEMLGNFSVDWSTRRMDDSAVLNN